MAQSREQITTAFVEVAFDDAYKIREAYTDLLAARKANRVQLRGLADTGHLTEAQNAELDDLYPPRATKDEEAEESAAAA